MYSSEVVYALGSNCHYVKISVISLTFLWRNSPTLNHKFKINSGASENLSTAKNILVFPFLMCFAFEQVEISILKYALFNSQHLGSVCLLVRFFLYYLKKIIKQPHHQKIKDATQRKKKDTKKMKHR